MADISFAVSIPVFVWDGLTLVLVVLGVMLVYWAAKAIITIVQGG